MKTQTDFSGNFNDRIFRLIYAVWNKASLTKLKESNGGDLDITGFSKLKFLENDKKALDERLAKMYQNAVAAVDFYNEKSAHNLSSVGNMPMSLESLATKEEIDSLSKITQSILQSNPEIASYLGLEISQLSLELTVLCNTTSQNSVDQKEGSQNFHRDVYHSFYRGIKLFYAYNYRADLNDGGFSFIPLTSIGANVRPSNKLYPKKLMKERRFDLHPLIVNALPQAQVLKEKELTAIDTYNCFHSGGHITSPGFIRLIFQVVVSPPQTPDRFSNITDSHLGRMFYFNMIRVRNIFRARK